MYDMNLLAKLMVLLHQILFNLTIADTAEAFQNHPGHLGGWVVPWLTEEILDGQCLRVDIPAQARTAHNGLLAGKTGGRFLLNRPSCNNTPNNQISHGTEMNWRWGRGVFLGYFVHFTHFRHRGTLGHFPVGKPTATDLRCPAN